MVGTGKVGTGSDKYRESFARADVLLRGIADGVTVQDREGRLVYANDAAARQCGLPDARTMLAASTHEILDRFEMQDEHGAPLDPALLPGRRALAGEASASLLLRVRDRKTGRVWWSLVRAHAITNEGGVPELAVNIWHDASKEQRQREAARLLADATSRLAASLDYSDTLVSVARALVPGLADFCSVDLLDHGVIRPLAVAHADREREQQAQAFLASYPPDPDATTGVAAVLRSGIAELHPELSPQRAGTVARDDRHDAAKRTLGLCSSMIVPIVVEGKAAGTLSLATAESGRRYDEDDLELAREIGRRAGTAIAHARAYASAKMAIRSRDEFLAVAGHELRTPLAALMLQIESLKLNMKSGVLARDPERFAMRIDKSFGHALRLARLVDGMLDVPRISDGRIELKREEIDLSVLVRETCERFADDATRAGSTLTVHEAHACTGHWDPSRLEQIVSNLLTNATKYGGGKPIDVRFACARDTVTLLVEDHGIGIAAEDRERIFRRFERAVSERNYPGFGLGLWITRELVLAHGGSIHVTSEPSRGSTFTVTLPRRPQSG